MRLLELTLDTPQRNLALDEALLEEAESESGGEVLRLWEPAEPFVVVGRSSRLAQEVDLPACRLRGVPVLRRCSGGAAVVAGPGCLMYAVVLRYQTRPHLRMIDQAHRFVLQQIAAAAAHFAPVEPAGVSDLACGPARRKFSGNSLRCKRNCLLYHGTLLYDFPLQLISECLRLAPRQPAYRAGRDHDQFVTNFPADAAALRAQVAQVWNARPNAGPWPVEQVEQLVAERYSQAHWNEKL